MTRYRIASALLFFIAGCAAWGQEAVIDDFSGDTLNPRWQLLDVGPDQGTAGIVNGELNIMSGGTDIWSSADGFSYLYFKVKGDFQATVRVTSIADLTPYTRQGIMVRANETAGSPNVLMTCRRDGGTAFTWRLAQDQDTNWPGAGGSPDSPILLRITRQGIRFVGEESLDDGETWTGGEINRIDNPGLAASEVMVGIAADSNTPGTLALSTFDDFRLTPIQTVTGIKGMARDRTGTAAAGVLVTATGPDGAVWSGATDAAGAYSVAVETAGTYRVSVVEIPGTIVGEEKTVEVKTGEIAGAPDLTYISLPFFLAVDPKQAASTPQDDDFPGNNLSSKWTGYDLGTETDGASEVSDGILSTTSTTSDFWNNADNGRFTAQAVSGNFVAYVKILSQPTFEEMGLYGKHGLMVRLSEDAGSPEFSAMARTSGHNFSVWRMEQDGASDAVLGGADSYKPGQWLKLVRKGGLLVASHAPDDTGTGAVVLGGKAISIPSFAANAGVLIGVADCTGLEFAGEPSVATYDTFRLLPYNAAVEPFLGTAVVPGDLNGDGKVTVTDATLALRFAVGLAQPTAVQLEAGDFRKQGRISVMDVTKILRIAVGLE